MAVATQHQHEYVYIAEKRVTALTCWLPLLTIVGRRGVALNPVSATGPLIQELVRPSGSTPDRHAPSGSQNSLQTIGLFDNGRPDPAASTPRRIQSGPGNSRPGRVAGNAARQVAGQAPPGSNAVDYAGELLSMADGISDRLSLPDTETPDMGNSSSRARLSSYDRNGAPASPGRITPSTGDPANSAVDGVQDRLSIQTIAPPRQGGSNPARATSMEIRIYINLQEIGRPATFSAG